MLQLVIWKLFNISKELFFTYIRRRINEHFSERDPNLAEMIAEFLNIGREVNIYANTTLEGYREEKNILRNLVRS